MFSSFRLPVADSEGSFTVESSLSLDLWIHVLIDDSTDIHVFEIQSPSGQIFAFPKFDAGLIYFSLRGPRETGVWTYRIRLYAGSATRFMLLECWAAGAADQVRLTSWSRLAGSGPGAPALLYARLEQAGLPVLQAELTARVRRPGSEALILVRMVDDGSGYPDITRGDGIYSAYFTQFSTETLLGGTYSLEVEAINNGTAGVLNTRRSETLPALGGCCGSSLPVAPAIPLESFRRFSMSASFSYNPFASSSPAGEQNRTGLAAQKRDLFPPSRISDFRLANYFNNSLFVTLAWSAPGDDLTGGGPAFRYEIRCFTDRAALSEQNFAEQGILVHASLVPSPGQPGQEQRSSVAVPWAREVFYYAIVGIDAAGNRAEVSNIIAVFVEEPVIEETAAAALENSTLIYMNMEDINSNNNMLLQSVLQSDGLMYIIAGVISLILIIIVLILAIIIKRLGVCGGAKKAKPSSSSANESLEEETDSAPYMPDLCLQDGSFVRNSVSYVSGYDLAETLEFTLRSPQKAAAQEVTHNNNNNHHHHRILDPRYYADSLVPTMKHAGYSGPAVTNHYGGSYHHEPMVGQQPPPPPAASGICPQQSPSISPVNSTYTAHSTDCSVSVSSSDPDQQTPSGGSGGDGGSLQVLAPGSAGLLQVLPASTSSGQYQLAYGRSRESSLGSQRHSRPEPRPRKIPPAVPSKTVHASLV